MPAIVTLTTSERATILKLLNDLNLGFPLSGFAEAYLAMLDGAPVTLTALQKRDLPSLIDNLNLGFAHINAGELMVGLLDAGTQKATAAALKPEQITKLHDLFNRLNMGTFKHDIGGKLQAVITKLNTVVPVAAVVDGKTVAAGTIGGAVIAPSALFSVSSGTLATYLDTVTVSGGTASGTWDSTKGLTVAPHAKGDITLTFTVKGGATKGTTVPTVSAVVPLFDELTMTAPAPNAITGDFKTGYLMATGPKIDGSAAITVTIAPNADATLPANWTVAASAGGTKVGNIIVTKVAGANSVTFTIKAAGTTNAPAVGDKGEVTVTAGSNVAKLLVTFVAA